MSIVGVCVNCLAYHWQCDQSSLRQCSRCKGMSYCSEICQLEHYNKVHRKHCKYMAGIKVKEKSIHTVKNCLRCSVRGKMRAGEFSNPASSVWPCIFEDLWFPDIEPFPKLKNKQTGKMQIMFKGHGYLLPVDLGEVSGKFTGFHEHLVSTITHICLKLTFINPECKDRMDKIIKDLCNVRFSCWRIFCVMPNRNFSEETYLRCFVDEKSWSAVTDLCVEYTEAETVGRRKQGGIMWWHALHLFWGILRYLPRCRVDKVIYPQEFRTMVQAVLDSVQTKMIPFEEIVVAMCGGSEVLPCTSCGAEVSVRGAMPWWVGPRRPRGDGGIICLGSQGVMITCNNCPNLYTFKRQGDNLLYTLREEEKDLIGVAPFQCHQCASPSGGRPRCKYCQSKIYCDAACQAEDWPIHELFCKKIQEAAEAGEEGRRKSKHETDRRLQELNVKDFRVPFSRPEDDESSPDEEALWKM